ncbi:lipocalin-like domain-containing protein [Streptomyces chiangmaiensis]|uniref:Lipocalin-like domain-containing protein n=1 Tax=Streptomyces chiangmaiensis TaxID=766497 RepID=A0ABU7FG39_9ACTN|nr:lipocalin-like domain-containing protein [Streptomyces chiangmaiensis]MED7823095.1 lipocalin-like domain-containing protein [Streptomyces chiangmaiensis]
MTLTGELLIGAATLPASAGTMMALNPATGELIEPEFAFGGRAEVDRAVRLADEGAAPPAATPWKSRICEHTEEGNTLMTTSYRTDAGSERAAAEAVRERLLGAWTLVSYTATGTDGRVIHPLGPTPHGLIVYTAEGYMSAQLSRRDRPATGSERLEDTPPEALARAAVTYIAYGGPFEVVDPTTVRHHVTTSLFPDWVGRPQVRRVTFDDALLKLGLVAPVHMWGADRTAELTWRKPD